MDGKPRALDWILSAALAIAYAAGLAVVVAYGRSDDLLATAVMLAMGTLGFLFILVEAVRFAKPPFALFQGGVLSALSFLCPLVLLEGLNPPLLLLGLVAVVVPSCAFAAAFAWAERSGSRSARLVMRGTAGAIFVAGVVVGAVQLAPGLCARYDLLPTAVEHPTGLEFRLVAEIGKDGLTGEQMQPFVESGQSPPGWIWAPLAGDEASSGLPRDAVQRFEDGKTHVLLADDAPYIMTPTQDPTWGIRSAKVTEEKQSGGKAVWVFLDVTFDQRGGIRLHELSESCRGRALAIVVGGTIRSAPIVETPLGSSVRIRVGVARGTGSSLVEAGGELRRKAESLRALF